MNKNILSWERDAYSVSALMNRPLAEVKKEYSRLRSIARKRLERLGKSDFASSQAYQMNKKGFKPLAQLQGQQIYYNLNALMRFITAKASTVTGQKEIRAKEIRTLHEHGYTFVNVSNYFQFIEFMETVRNTTNNMQLPSEEIADFFETHYKQSVSLEQLERDFISYLDDYF